jgi:hypothetical protein
VPNDVVSLIPGFSEAFRGNGDIEGGFAAWSETDYAALDYSVDSLAEVDRLLDAIRPVQDQLEWQVYTNTVLAIGAYVGEVLRRQGDSQWEWMNFDDFMRLHIDLATSLGIKEEGLNVAAVLMAGKQVTLPFNKVMRNLEEGPENSVHFYVTAMGAGD